MAAGNPKEAQNVRCQTVGLPMPGVKMQIKAPDPAYSLEEGEGEIWCQHPSGFEGYVDTTGKPIVLNQGNEDGFLATKDLGKLRVDGYLEVWGRCNCSVNRDGLLVLFSDIEREMEKIVGIDRVVVESSGESQRGKGLVAFCVLSKAVNLSEDEIRASCFDLLPKRAIPDQVLILKTLPMLPNGKVDRQQLISFLPRVF